MPPADVAPIWDPSNAIGTSTLQTMGMPVPTVYAGRAGEFINPSTGQLTTRGQERMANPAMGMDTGGLGAVGATARMAEDVALSRRVGYIPSPRDPRLVTEDYLHGVPVDAAGNLTHTPEGVLLTAENVAGRREVSSTDTFPDRGVDPAAIESIAKNIRGADVLGVAQKTLGRDVIGAYDPVTGNIRYSQSLTPGQQDVVIPHEVAHLIDHVAGTIPTKGLVNKELTALYDALNNPQVKTPSQPFWRPQNDRYTGENVHRELMAEAIRAYMQDPNYLKTAAPDTAKVIRDAVNSNPRLNRWIQFNTAAGLATGSAAALGSGGQPEQ